MRSLTLLIVMAFVAVALPAYAADDDLIMGNYQGSLTGKVLEGRTLRVQVATMPKFTYRAVFFISTEGGKELRFEIQGKKAGVKQAEFSGNVDLGEALGGIYTINAAIKNETLTGAFQPMAVHKKKSAKKCCAVCHKPDKANCGACKDAGSGKCPLAAFELKRTILKSPTLDMTPPPGAVVLFDGKNTDCWQRWPLTWGITGDGAMQVGGSNMVTKQEFGDAQYHVEFMTPFMPDELGQGRGNSGVYIAGRYEVQVLDSFADIPADNLCGGIYKKAVPLAAPCLPPLQWQTYDITFISPKFDASGKKVSNAEITVVHNGIIIHDKLVMD
ncbi:MAG TPA: DUF1080 domain-containing protein, partial [Candidatus Hydrogenedentes bacterium]|nr:DUF1080 domain-containing protein [Candidatus Hydrogenedentota bacterium]